ncbi:MAG: hypothetical protein R2873_20370 [Caldilineaceae bacterium]
MNIAAVPGNRRGWSWGATSHAHFLNGHRRGRYRRPQRQRKYWHLVEAPGMEAESSNPVEETDMVRHSVDSVAGR